MAGNKSAAKKHRPVKAGKEKNPVPTWVITKNMGQWRTNAKRRQ